MINNNTINNNNNNLNTFIVIFLQFNKLVTKTNEMKPKYALRVQSQKSLNPNSKAEAVVARKHTNLKNQQQGGGCTLLKRERRKGPIFP